MSARETIGFFHDDIPFLKIGEGPPLVAVQGLTPEHDVPKGPMRRWALALAQPLAHEFTVYVVNRKRGLEPGETMSDIAGHLASAIEHDLAEPVFLQGASTGGSVALQLAVDRPDLVRRLVVASAAYRLGARGRELQVEMANLVRAGQPREAWATVMAANMLPGLHGPARRVFQLGLGGMVPSDPNDMLVTLDAENVFDIGPDLARITAPTLVIGGAKDIAYTRELFEGTARGAQDGRAHIFENWGHVRAAMSTATTHLTLGFMLAGLPATGRGQPAPWS